MLEVLGKLGVGDLVVAFELAVLLAALLNGVVGEVHKLVAEVLQVELFAGSAQVSLLVPVKLKSAFNRQSHHKSSDVKFSAVVQEKVFYIGLNYDLPVLC